MYGNHLYIYFMCLTCVMKKCFDREKQDVATYSHKILITVNELKSVHIDVM